LFAGTLDFVQYFVRLHQQLEQLFVRQYFVELDALYSLKNLNVKEKSLIQKALMKLPKK
jgi:hypothetical protein